MAGGFGCLRLVVGLRGRFRLRLERMSGGRGDWWAVEAPPRMPLQVAVACLHLATTNHTLWPACPLVATTLGERGGGGGCWYLDSVDEDKTRALTCTASARN